MAVEIRGVEPGEEGAFADSVCIPFLDQPSERHREASSLEQETGRCFVAVDGGRMVGNAAVHSRDVTVPARPGVPCPVVSLAAVTSVGVHPTHRRRGLLRQLMAAMVDQARERQESLAGLCASEAGIYGRFGFGVAVQSATVTLDRTAVRFAVPPAPLDLSLLTAEEAGDVLPGVFERIRRSRPGEVSRPAGAWAVRLRNLGYPPGPAPFYAAGDRGYVAYRVHEDSPGLGGESRIVVQDLVGEDPEVEAGLWAYLVGVDLVRSVTASKRPLGESVKWRLADPRAWRTTGVGDQLWVRVLDVPAALSARAYPVEGSLVLDVCGEAAEPAAGRWRLECGPDGSEVGRARGGEATDLRLGLADLGALYLGGVPASTLVAAGRAEEQRPGAAGCADAVLASPVAPVSSTTF